MYNYIMDKDTQGVKTIKLSSKERRILKTLDKSSKWEDIKQIDNINKEIIDLDIYKDFIGLGCSRYLNESADTGKIDIEEMFRNCREAEKVRVRTKKKERREEAKGQRGSKGGLTRGNVGALTKQNLPQKEIPSEQKKFQEAPQMSKKDLEKYSKTFNDTMEKNGGDIKKSMGDIAVQYSGLYCLEGGIQGVSSILYGITNTFKDTYNGIGYENGSWTMDDNIFNGLRDIVTKCGPVALLYKLSDFTEYLNFKGWKKAEEFDKDGKPVKKGKKPKTTPEPSNKSAPKDDDDDEDGEDPDEKGGEKIKAQEDLETKQPAPQDNMFQLLQNQMRHQAQLQQTSMINSNMERLFQQNPLGNILRGQGTPQATPQAKQEDPTPKQEDPQPQENLNTDMGGSSTLRGTSILTGVGASILAGGSYINDWFNGLGGGAVNQGIAGAGIEGQQGTGIGGTGEEALSGLQDSSLSTPQPNTQPTNLNPQQPAQPQNLNPATSHFGDTQERERIARETRENNRKRDQEQEQNKKVRDYMKQMDANADIRGVIGGAFLGPLFSDWGGKIPSGLGAGAGVMPADPYDINEEFKKMSLQQKEEEKALQGVIQASLQAEKTAVKMAEENERLKEEIALQQRQEAGTGGLGYDPSEQEQELIRQQAELQRDIERRKKAEQDSKNTQKEIDKRKKEVEAEVHRQQKIKQTETLRQAEEERLKKIMEDQAEEKRIQEEIDRLAQEDRSPPPEQPAEETKVDRLEVKRIFGLTVPATTPPTTVPLTPAVAPPTAGVPLAPAVAPPQNQAVAQAIALQVIAGRSGRPRFDRPEGHINARQLVANTLGIQRGTAIQRSSLRTLNNIEDPELRGIIGALQQEIEKDRSETGHKDTKLTPAEIERIAVAIARFRNRDI
jgi:hypothetical protein